jgi:hypothetical protein
MLDADGIRFVCAIVLISFGLYHIVPYFIVTHPLLRKEEEEL